MGSASAVVERGLNSQVLWASQRFLMTLAAGNDSVNARRTPVFSKPVATDPELQRLLDMARQLPPMTHEQIEAQRKSWVIGEMMLEHEDMSREEAEAIYSQVTGK